MNPSTTFFFGLLLLVLFGWYFITDAGRTKRILGSLLTVLLVVFCMESFNIHYGLDLQGGTTFVLRLMRDQGTLDKDTVNQAVEVIRKRVDAFGTSEPIITPEGADRIRVQIPGLDTEKIDEARIDLQKVAKLEFRTVYPQSSSMVPAIKAGQAVMPPGYEIKPLTEDDDTGKPRTEELLVKKTSDLGGQHVVAAHAYYDQRGYGVSVKFDSEGASQFGKLTEFVFNQKTRLAILLDGVVICAPGVNDGPIYGGSAQITGDFTEQYARNLASSLENPLQTPVSIEEERATSSTLGQDSIRSGIYAGVGGLLLVLFFVVVYYRFAGLVAIFGLVVNIVLLFGIMSTFNFVLTLPGIAGIILTIGLAIDANVLVYERLREEMSAGKTLSGAVEGAYNKAFSVIFDANATTLITAAILFWKGSGPIKGFAVTLTVGIIASVFSAMVVTRTLFGWGLQLGWIKKLSMLHLINPEQEHDFMGRRRLWIGISVAVIALSIVTFSMRGQKNFGVDFTGGDLLTVQPATPVTVSQVRDALSTLPYEKLITQESEAGAKGEPFVTIRTPKDTGDKVRDTLTQNLHGVALKIVGKDTVGSVVGGELARSSLWAFALAVVGILLYVTARFEFSFAVGAIVALLHDVIITVGVFTLFGRELSLIMVGAILTIAGYSINDTIVVYDRIREGLHSGRRGSVQEIMNSSINETLSRTLLTSGCTLLSVLALFFFGGAVLKDFALAILIGVVVGTYSSIFIASPIVLWWSSRGRGNTGSLQSEVRRSQAAAGSIS